MKRYFLFGGPDYCEKSGGFNDYNGQFDTIEEAQTYWYSFERDNCYWAHIIDMETLKEVWSY